MDRKTLEHDLRHSFGMNGWVLLIYYGIMNISVFIAIILDVIILKPNTNGAGQSALERASGNGWGYLIACILGGVLLLIWKKPKHCFCQIWSHEKKMSGKAFFVLLSAFLTGQAIQILLFPVIEWLLSLLGLSASVFADAATAGSSTLSMFLYVAVFAPLFEEILFRGVILHNFLPYGKKFAIFASSFLFGIFHGNLIQTPYAFIVGLVLGYAAVEYGLVWSILLHLINNLVLGELLVYIDKQFPLLHINLLLYLLLFCCTIVTVVLSAVKWRSIAEYFSYRRIHPMCLKNFFLSMGVIVFTVIMLWNILSLLLL